MTSLNISLPEALKNYVEGQVASGDWGTPSEYIRELIRQDKERRLASLEQELLAAARGPKIEVSLTEIRKKGLVAALRESATGVRRARIQLSALAIADILEQADWYEARSDHILAKRWEKAVAASLAAMSRAPNAGSPCRFNAEELKDTRRVPVAGFPKHLIFYRCDGDAVLILRVIHGARDLESLLKA